MSDEAPYPCSDQRCGAEIPHFHCRECDAAIDEPTLCAVCSQLGDDWDGMR